MSIKGMDEWFWYGICYIYTCWSMFRISYTPVDVGGAMIATQICDGKYVIFSDKPLTDEEILIIEENPEILMILMKKKGMSYPCKTKEEALEIVKERHGKSRS